MNKNEALHQLCALVKSEQLLVATNSTEVTEGAVFVALPAAKAVGAAVSQGGEQYIDMAIDNGAKFVVVEPLQISSAQHQHLAEKQVQVVTVASTRKALGELAQAAYNTKVCCPKIIGITGTNGKTTESFLLEHLFTQAGFTVGVIGTVTYRWPGHCEDAPLTTPNCLTLHSILAQMYKAGVDYAFMEVSSHALDQDRVAGLDFTGALLTNVTQDHLDYHTNMSHYFAAKRKLFAAKEHGGVPYYTKARCCNMDDAYGLTLVQEMPEIIGYGFTYHPELQNPQLVGRIEAMTPQGMRLRMLFDDKEWVLNSPLVGDFNASNLLGAQALALSLGLEVKQLASLQDFFGVSGRLERVPNPQNINAFVDYAHTPDALINVLSSLKKVGFKRIITVFGCGGDRDKTKRPLMGAAAAQFSDIVVVTSDNPRTENPIAIINDILPGVTGCPQVITEENRQKALEKAVGLVGPDDALLVAGKGHETYQIIGTTKYPFSDHSVLKELLQ